MKPFDFPSAAARYAEGRPDFHSLIADKIRKFLRIDGCVSHALDVGCGTGLSSRALRAIADRVDGVDCSAAMLFRATPMEGVTYHVADAEHLPFEDGAFDLITVSCAFHWLDRGKFLAEARRVLRDGGHLVIYDNTFPGEMQENPEFREWQQEHYARYPRTHRDTSPFGPDEAGAAGFDYLQREEYTNDVTMTPQQLALYLSSQSNAIEAVEKGSQSAEEFLTSVEAGVRPYFGGKERATFKFAGYVAYLKKRNS